MTELTMQVERSIAAPREAVFRAWLDPEMLRRFMLPGQDMTVPRADVDAREGGARVPQAGEVRQARLHGQLFEDGVVARARLAARDGAGGVSEVAEHDRVGRAGLLAGRDHLAVGPGDLEQLDEPGDAQDVEHGQRAEKQPSQDQKYAFATFIQRRGS